jgi:hypothetical protein
MNKILFFTMTLLISSLAPAQDTKACKPEWKVCVSGFFIHGPDSDILHPVDLRANGIEVENKDDHFVIRKSGVLEVDHHPIGFVKGYPGSEMTEALEAILDQDISLTIIKSPTGDLKVCHKSPYGIYTWDFFHSHDLSIKVKRASSEILNLKFNSIQYPCFKTRLTLFCHDQANQ